MASPRIRPTAPADLAALADIEGWAIENGVSNFMLERRHVDDWRARFDARESRHPWLVADVEGRVAGFALAFPYRVRAAYRWTTEISVYVHPDHHGQGVGTALYERLLELLRAGDFHTVIAILTTPNPASERLHEKVGFRRIGTLTDVGWKNDAWHDTTIYEQRLRKGPPNAKGA